MVLTRKRASTLKNKRGRKPNSASSCGTNSYLKKRPNSSLVKCTKPNETCKSKSGVIGKVCQKKSKKGRRVGSKDKVARKPRKMTAKRLIAKVKKSRKARVKARLSSIDDAYAAETAALKAKRAEEDAEDVTYSRQELVKNKANIRGRPLKMKGGMLSEGSGAEARAAAAASPDFNVGEGGLIEASKEARTPPPAPGQQDQGLGDEGEDLDGEEEDLRGEDGLIEASKEAHTPPPAPGQQDQGLGDEEDSGNGSAAEEEKYIIVDMEIDNINKCHENLMGCIFTKDNIFTNVSKESHTKYQNIMEKIMDNDNIEENRSKLEHLASELKTEKENSKTSDFVIVDISGRCFPEYTKCIVETLKYVNKKEYGEWSKSMKEIKEQSETDKKKSKEAAANAAESG